MNMTLDPILLSIVGFFLALCVGAGVYLYRRQYGEGDKRYVREMMDMVNKGITHARGSSFELSANNRKIRITPVKGSKTAWGATRDQWIILIDNLPKGLNLTIYPNHPKRPLVNAPGAQPLDTEDEAFNKKFASEDPKWASELMRNEFTRQTLEKLHEKYDLNALIVRDIGAVVLELKREGLKPQEAVTVLGVANSFGKTIEVALRTV